jgi:hypothetical protein
VVGALPWHIVVADGVGVDGIPTVGVTKTVVETIAEGPLHPFASTFIVADPVKPAAQVTVAVAPVPEIVFPDPVTLQI